MNLKRLPEEMETCFVDSVFDTLSIFNKYCNEKYFKKLIEFLIDQLPNIGIEQPYEGSVCEYNLSPKIMDEDVDHQVVFEADSNADPHNVDLVCNVDAR